MRKLNTLPVCIGAYFMLASLAWADTPPPSSVRARVYSGNNQTAITATGTSLDVNVTNGVTAVVNSSLGAPLFTQTVAGGNVVDPRARTWSLLDSTDSVTAFQGGAPWTIGLPAGASTSALQTAANNLLTSILSALGGTLTTSVSNFPATQAISAVSLPLPSNAAQETGGNLAAINSKITTTPNGIRVDTSGVVQPVSGSVAVSNFPASQNVNVRDGSGNSIGSTSGSLNVNVTNSLASNPSVSATGAAVPAQATYVAARDGSSNLRGLMVNGSGALMVDGSGSTQPVSGSISVSNFPATQPVSAATLPLPSNAAQETGGNLATIATRATSLDGKVLTGQQTMANSVGVVIASNQTAVPVSGSVSVSNFPATQPVSGTVTANQGTPQLSLSNAWPTRLTDGTNTAAVSASGAVRVDGSAVTQPVSASTLPLPSNAAVEAGGNLAAINTKLGTGPIAQNVSITQSQGSVAGGPSASVSTLSGGVYNATPPTLTNGQQVALQVDDNGNLKTTATLSGSSVSVDNFPAVQPVSGTVNVGNFPATQTVAGTIAVSNFPATQPVSGTVTANQGGAPWSQNLTQLSGNAPSATNSLPTRITNGTTFVDPTQIRALTASDVVTSNQGGTWNVGRTWTLGVSDSVNAVQSGSWTTGRTWNLSSGADSVASAQSGTWNVGRTWNLSSVGDSIAATQSGTWNIANVTGTVSLPTNAAQETGGNLASLNTKVDVNLSTRASAANQTNGSQKTQVVDLVGNIMPAGDTTARGVFVRPGDGTNTASYTASGEQRVLVTPLTNTSVVKSQLQDNAGNGLTSTVVGGARALDANVVQAVTTSDKQASGNIAALNAAVAVATNGAGSVTVSVTGTWSATLTFEASNDNGVTYPFTINGSAVPSGALATTTGANGTFLLMAGGYTNVRVRASAYTSGTAVVALNSSSASGLVRVFQNNPASLQAQVVGNVADGATDSGNPVKIGGRYQATQTALTDGQRGDARVSRFGDLTTANSTQYRNITTATTTVVKNSPGLLYAICYNLLINNGTVTIYDNTTAAAPIIGTQRMVLGVGAASPSGCVRYDGVNFNTGLTIVTSGASDLTVLYK